jgi:hypothetical protein
MGAIFRRIRILLGVLYGMENIFGFLFRAAGAAQGKDRPFPEYRLSVDRPAVKEGSVMAVQILENDSLRLTANDRMNPADLGVLLGNDDRAFLPRESTRRWSGRRAPVAAVRSG